MNKTLYARYLAVIGGQVNTIALDGDNGIVSYDDARSSAFPAALGSGAATSNVYGDPSILVCAALPTSAEGENYSYSDNIAYVLQAISLDSDLVINSDSDCIGYICRVSSAGSDDENYSDVDCVAYICKGIDASSDNTVTHSYTTSNASAFHYVQMAIDGIEINSYGLANASSLYLKEVAGKSISESDAHSILQSLNTVFGDGTATNTNHAVATSAIASIIVVFGDAMATSYNLASLTNVDTESLNGVAISLVNAAGAGDPLDAIGGGGNDELQTGATGMIALWYLPVQTGTNLYIRQVFEEAIPNGTNLEVM